jgi:transcription elongation factor GreB
MSKAFTRESDTAEEDDLPEGGTPLPAGSKNYMTPEGFARLQEELRYLTEEERPRVVEVVAWAAGNGDRSENGDYIYGKKRLREIDRRIRFLTKRLEIAEVVDPARQRGLDRVYFGATVTYVTADDEERTIRIVGVDEARQERGEVSWISPIARALHKAAEGDVVRLRTPAGVEEIEVIRIAYGDG